jgi:hypothetical protein
LEVLRQVCDQGQHSGIVRLLHSFLNSAPPCLAYEYIEGSDLADLIRERGSMKPEQSAKVILHLAEAIGFMHRLQQPIIHRDLIPANILVKRGADGKASYLVTDFGIGTVIAKKELAEYTHRPASSGEKTTLGVRGAYTPLYASPQQMRGAPPEPRDDVHALGVIWYQLLTGDMGRGAPTGQGWLSELTKDGMTEPLIDLLEKCFEYDPKRRRMTGDFGLVQTHTRAAQSRWRARGPRRACARSAGLRYLVVRYALCFPINGPLLSRAFARQEWLAYRKSKQCRTSAARMDSGHGGREPGRLLRPRDWPDHGVGRAGGYPAGGCNGRVRDRRIHRHGFLGRRGGRVCDQGAFIGSGWGIHPAIAVPITRRAEVVVPRPRIVNVRAAGGPGSRIAASEAGRAGPHIRAAAAIALSQAALVRIATHAAAIALPHAAPVWVIAALALAAVPAPPHPAGDPADNFGVVLSLAWFALTAQGAGGATPAHAATILAHAWPAATDHAAGGATLAASPAPTRHAAGGPTAAPIYARGMVANRSVNVS